ncbi:MAG: hypothetical protein CM1200mP20_06450 [Pseudomonadota bacterium]|nr:MAG: hypothetical protein CM1200mP20_06450 [Pseudomonadota bacterium]
MTPGFPVVCGYFVPESIGQQLPNVAAVTTGCSPFMLRATSLVGPVGNYGFEKSLYPCCFPKPPEASCQGIVPSLQDSLSGMDLVVVARKDAVETQRPAMIEVCLGTG